MLIGTLAGSYFFFCKFQEALCDRLAKQRTIYTIKPVKTERSAEDQRVAPQLWVHENKISDLHQLLQGIFLTSSENKKEVNRTLMTQFRTFFAIPDNECADHLSTYYVHRNDDGVNTMLTSLNKNKAYTRLSKDEQNKHFRKNLNLLQSCDKLLNFLKSLPTTILKISIPKIDNTTFTLEELVAETEMKKQQAFTYLP